MEQKLLEMVQVTVPILLFSRNLINEEGRTKKHTFLDIICKIGQNHHFWAIRLHFSDFIKTKQNWNSNFKFNYFQHLFHTFPPSMIFLVLVLMPRILKADFRGDVVIEFKRAHGSNVNFHYIIISYKIERKNGKKLFNSFEISKNIISKFSGRALIGQNDSLDVLLLDEFLL